MHCTRIINYVILKFLNTNDSIKTKYNTLILILYVIWITRKKKCFKFTFTLIYNFTVVDLFDNFYLLSNCYIRDVSLLSLENYIIMLPFMHIIQTQVNIAQQIPKYFEIK